MVGRMIPRLALLAHIFLLTQASGASAQFAPPPTLPPGSSLSSASMMANPYMNPYLNPYLNPLAAQKPMTPSNAALYMYQANLANGGIGSGRISGARGSSAAGQARQKPALMPNTSSVPGAGAARFFNPFNPALSNGNGLASNKGKGNGTNRYFNKPTTYFNSNGH